MITEITSIQFENTGRTSVAVSLDDGRWIIATLGPGLVDLVDLVDTSTIEHGHHDPEMVLDTYHTVAPSALIQGF